MAEQLIPETRLEHWLDEILNAAKGGGDDPKTYTVSGTGTTPAALPEGLSIPDEMTEGFTATLDMAGYYRVTDGPDTPFEVTGVPLDYLGVLSGNYSLEMSFSSDDVSAEFGIEDGDVIFTYAYFEGSRVIDDNVNWTITFTDSRGGSGG